MYFVYIVRVSWVEYVLRTNVARIGSSTIAGHGYELKVKENGPVDTV